MENRHVRGVRENKDRCTRLSYTPGPRGSGPALLLLHGYPQTHVEWHKVAPALAEEFTVVCPDLRGYGDSQKPLSSNGDLSTYCKRTSAHDQVAVMEHLGFERFHLVGHDRGVRVGLRLALDHPG